MKNRNFLSALVLPLLVIFVVIVVAVSCGPEESGAPADNPGGVSVELDVDKPKKSKPRTSTRRK